MSAHTQAFAQRRYRDNGESLDVTVPWLDAVNSEIGRVLKLPLTALEELPSPRMFKVHLPYELTAGGFPHTTKSKYIYLARFRMVFLTNTNEKIC